MTVAMTFQPCALTFAPHFEERVWGGRRLENYGRELPADLVIGESWEISAIAGRSSVVTRGPYAGKNLTELLEANRAAIVGDVDPALGTFPLLVKLLDSSTPLSVQLHPNDEEALALEGAGDGHLGKTEAWIVLEAEEGAEVIHGLAPGVDPAEFFARMEAAEGEALDPQEERDLFRWVPVGRGDVVFVPAGTIHALGEGVVLAEVQQHSDLTYRIYDWGRRTPEGELRKLHIEKARGIEAPELVDCPLCSLADVKSDPAGELVPILSCEQFRFDLLNLEPGGSFRASTKDGDQSGFHLWITWDGALEYSGLGEEGVSVDPVNFLLLPASLGEYELRTEAASRALLVRV